MGNDAETVKVVTEIVTAVATSAAVLWATWTYHRSVKLQRAKWMKELYEKFYERDDLKKIRELLDSDDQAKVAELVKAESGDFTDYLNFFEFLAYLLDSKQIRREEVLGLFDYYLRNLKPGKNKDVANYIAKAENGFEQLQKLLGTIG